MTLFFAINNHTWTTFFGIISLDLQEVYFWKMNFFTQLTERYPLIRNKYLLVVLGFLVWIVFFDKNNLISQYEDRQALYELKKEKRYYQEEIENTHEQLNELMTDNRSLEKFAREKYLMKKDNEAIWLVIDKSKKPKE